MFAQAQELIRHEGLAERVELSCGDAAMLPYSDQFFDGIFMSFTLELFDTPELSKVLAQCWRVLRNGGRLVVVGMSKEGHEGVVVHIFEWTHRHFPNFLDCRPIFMRRAIEAAGFKVLDATLMHMWVPVEIVLASKEARPQ